MTSRFTISCPRCGSVLEPRSPVDQVTMWRCVACAFEATGRSGYLDLFGGPTDDTADHYSLQWGPEFGFLDFVRGNRAAKAVMPAGQLGWDELIEEIRRAAAERVVYVYDAGCGFGGIASDLLEDRRAPGLVYLGSDIHDALPLIAERVPRVREQGLLIRWDIGNPPPVREAFDYVVCRASLHHTPDPPKTFTALARSLKPGGKIAISVYRKKGVCREAVDDALRAVIGRLPREEAFELSRQFTVLGKALQQVTGGVDVPEELHLLGIPKGRTSVHSLVYYHLLKCFYNPTFGDRYSTLVNYDWYHPPYAYRYNLDEVRSWFATNGIDVIDVRSIDAQHYLAGLKQIEPATRR